MTYILVINIYILVNFSGATWDSGPKPTSILVLYPGIARGRGRGP